MVFTLATYQSATGCTSYGPAGARALLTFMEEMFPWQWSMGICNCRAVAGGSSYSHHAECRAYDMGIPTRAGKARPDLGLQAINLVLPHGRRLGIDHAIYNRTVWSARSPEGRYYSGAHPHYDHIHWGLTRNAGRYLTYATLVDVLGSSTQPQEADEMLPLRYGEEREDVRLLQGMMNVAYRSGLKEDAKFGPATRSAVLSSPLLDATGEDEAEPEGDVADGEEINARMYRRLLVDFQRASGDGDSGGLTRAEADRLYAKDGHGHRATVELG